MIVTAAPHILFLKDTDGDGKADQREVLYEGFTAGNPQLRVSHPALGPDGWVYVANGLRGGEVRRAGRPDAKAIPLGGKDFRFDLVNDRAEAIPGMGQFGNTFDRWGHRFVCDNRNHLRHVVFPTDPGKRNPLLVTPPLARRHRRPGGRAALQRHQGLPAEPELDDLEPARRPVHRRVRRLHLQGRAAARAVRRRGVHLRPDRQPRPPGDADARTARRSARSRGRRASSSWPRRTSGSARCP